MSLVMDSGNCYKCGAELEEGHSEGTCADCPEGVNCEVSTFLRVWSPEALKEAAMAHEDAREMPEQDFYNEDGSVNINACLVILLDPGSLPGCEIFETCVEGNSNQ